jgi:hypothetical protein
MKKPADQSCQRAALPISLGGLSIPPLTLHPEAEMMMVVVCQRAQHKLPDYRFWHALSTQKIANHHAFEAARYGD